MMNGDGENVDEYMYPYMDASTQEARHLGRVDVPEM